MEKARRQHEIDQLKTQIPEKEPTNATLEATLEEVKIQELSLNPTEVSTHEDQEVEPERKDETE